MLDQDGPLLLFALLVKVEEAFVGREGGGSRTKWNVGQRRELTRFRAEADEPGCRWGRALGAILEEIQEPRANPGSRELKIFFLPELLRAASIKGQAKQLGPRRGEEVKIAPVR